MLRKTKDNQFNYDHVEKLDKKNHDKAYEFCEGYKSFISTCKTERECVSYIIEEAKKNGYKDFYDTKVLSLKAGDKYYYNDRNKAVVLFTIGNKPLSDGINFLVAHIDSPRIDLKANPIYETDELCYFKTHYYGGIKKYQWPTVPLSMHGRIFREDGTYLDINVGEKTGDTQFIITDLLPHLERNDHGDKKISEAIKGEDLNILLGSIPFIDKDDKEKTDLVKKNILQILNKTYGITEKDFVRAEIEFVPATKPTDIGFDRSLIAGYGQDDRVCSYPQLIAELNYKGEGKTSVTVFTDKEEIGSEGNTGMVSNFLFDMIEDLADIANLKARDIYRKSICFSSDVTSAYDPTFSDVFESRNSSYLNRGVAVMKYTGSRGKSGSNDTSAETMAYVIKLLDDNDVIWQTGELGKVDIGGGGTISMYMSQRNVDTVDIGVPVLSMHSPYEVTAKLDIYHTYLGYSALLNTKE